MVIERSRKKAKNFKILEFIDNSPKKNRDIKKTIMKTIYLIRHAKSSWDYSDLTDFERPLNHRGKRDAPFMGEILKKLGVKPDLILSSPANRAVNTARIIAEMISFPLDDILYMEVLYGANEKELNDLVVNIKDNVNSLAIVGHNPGLTDFLHYICENDIDNIPTCGVASASFNINSWADFSYKCGELQFYEYPKKYNT